MAAGQKGGLAGGPHPLFENFPGSQISGPQGQGSVCSNSVARSHICNGSRCGTPQANGLSVGRQHVRNGHLLRKTRCKAAGSLIEAPDELEWERKSCSRPLSASGSAGHGHRPWRNWRRSGKASRRKPGASRVLCSNRAYRQTGDRGGFEANTVAETTRPRSDHRGVYCCWRDLSRGMLWQSRYVRRTCSWASRDVAIDQRRLVVARTHSIAAQRHLLAMESTKQTCGNASD